MEVKSQIRPSVRSIASRIDALEHDIRTLRSETADLRRELNAEKSLVRDTAEELSVVKDDIDAIFGGLKEDAWAEPDC